MSAMYNVVQVISVASQQGWMLYMLSAASGAHGVV